VALFLFASLASWARAEEVFADPRDGMTDRVIKITIYATSPKHHLPYEAYRLWMPYETRFTCAAALEQLSRKAIERTVARKLKVTVLGSSAACEVAAPII
jgi:hypothetical protein